MEIEKIIFMIVLSIGLICSFTFIIMVAILGRTRMKEVDEYIYGYKMPSDSIFFQLMRFPHYSHILNSRWGAKRAGSLDLYEHFDKKFKRPFLIAQIIVILGGVFMIIAVIIQNYFIPPA